MGDLVSIDRRPRVARPGDDRPAVGRPEPLWRAVLGARLRAERHERGLTLVDAADRAGISPQYLSEIERGRKDPSSEIVAAVAGALGSSVLELGALALEDLRSASRAAAPSSTGPVARLLAA
jgi:DNA-binding XRE family transcriptional regulator